MWNVCRNSIGILVACIAIVGFAQEAVLATAPVEYRDVDVAYAADGVVEAVRQSTVAAQISGRVIEIRFDVGDFVEKGQVIIRIDPREAGQALAGSQAQARQAQAALAEAKANYERTQSLYTQKFVSQAALDKALADYKAAQAQLQATLAGVGQAATAQSYSAITAPYSGVVATRHVEVGEMATPGKALMTGFDPKELRVTAAIPQYRLADVKSGMPARVEIPSINRWIDAASVSVLPASDARTLSTRVRITLPENTRGVFPGMFARAHFVMGQSRKLIVPTQAVLRRSELTAVYVIDANNRVVLRQVRLGERAGEAATEVLAGLVAGERVALDPVRAGMAVSVARTPL